MIPDMKHIEELFMHQSYRPTNKVLLLLSLLPVLYWKIVGGLMKKNIKKQT
jgi:hypothetical protein